MRKRAEQCLRKMCNTVYNTPGFLSERSWMYDDGVVLLHLEKAGNILNDNRFLPFLQQYCNRFVKDGKVPFVEPRPLSVDNINNGKVVLLAYRLTGREDYWQCVNWFLELYKKHPRIEENGGLWHKMRYPNQIWLDGIYMLHPFLADCATEFEQKNNQPENVCENSKKQLDVKEIYKDIANQLHLVNQYMYDEEKQLYYHAYDHSRLSFWCNKKTGLSPNFWGRSMGWLGMACVDILESLAQNERSISSDTEASAPDGTGETSVPDDMVESLAKNDAAAKERIELKRCTELVLRNLAEGIVRWQDKDTKVWYQLTALPEVEGNYLESSASAMFVYTLFKGMRLGVLPQEYRAVAEDGMEGLLQQFYRERDGMSEITSVCQVAGLGPDKCPKRDGTVHYYLSEPVVTNDKKGYGAFLAALCEYLN